MSSLRAFEQGKNKIRQARNLKGWIIEDPRWLKEASQVLKPTQTWPEEGPFEYGVSLATWKRFLGGKAITSEVFKAFCQVLKLNWEEVLEIDEAVESKNQEREVKLNGIKSLNQFLVKGYKLLTKQKIDRAEKKFEEASRIEPMSPDPWYWKAEVALARGNKQVALEYINKALDFDSQHLHSLVLKIKLLLLSGGNDRLKAQKIASHSYGISDILDSWLDCLEETKMFANLVNTNSELDRRCPTPIHQW